MQIIGSPAGAHVKSKPVASYTQRLGQPRIDTWSSLYGTSARLEEDSGESDLESRNRKGSGYSSDCILVEGQRKSSESDTTVAHRSDEEGDEEKEKAENFEICAVPSESFATQTSPKLFIELPVEIHQHISSYLSTRRDVMAYAQICRSTRASINDSVWRKCFERTFDNIEGADTHMLAKKYHYRFCVSESVTCFDLGQHGVNITSEIRQVQAQNQKECLKMLRTLIIESDGRKVRDPNGDEMVDGLNLSFIRTMLESGSDKFVDIIDSILNTDGALDDLNPPESGTINKPSSLVYIIQLILTCISLHPEHCNSKVHHFDISQSQVYATPEAQPIFLGKFKQELNVRWLLHTVNFFKFHLKAGAESGEGIVTEDYACLERDQYPQPWIGRIKPGTQPLGRFWKSAHTFLDNRELFILRTNKSLEENRIFSDSTDNGESFPDVEMFFDESKFPSSVWPHAWELQLRSNPFVDPHAPPTASRRRISPRKRKGPTAPPIISFYGYSSASKPAHFYGRLHALPLQGDIHGFQRIVLMKFYTDPLGNYQEERHFCYEGCVLPGGRIIVGRWWDHSADPNDDRTESGPFLWWNVDRSAAGITIDMEEGNEPGYDTLDFFDYVPK